MTIGKNNSASFMNPFRNLWIKWIPNTGCGKYHQIESFLPVLVDALKLNSWSLKTCIRFAIIRMLRLWVHFLCSFAYLNVFSFCCFWQHTKEKLSSNICIFLGDNGAIINLKWVMMFKEKLFAIGGSRAGNQFHFFKPVNKYWN